MTVGEEIQVLDHGFVCLERAMADDLSVVNAARVSLHNHHPGMMKGDDKLVNALMTNHHGTPFEHNCFVFRVGAPLFVFREWHRHRIGHSYNEWSARYSKLERKFYIPATENVRRLVGKQMDYTYEQAPVEDADWLCNNLIAHVHKGFDRYEQALERGIAKEQARLFLSVNIYSEMYWTCNARSLMAFLNLRAHPAAQWEIRQYAKVAEAALELCMPITHAAFNANGRVSP